MKNNLKNTFGKAKQLDDKEVGVEALKVGVTAALVTIANIILEAQKESAKG